MELFGILAAVLSAVIGVVSNSITNAQNQQNANEQLANQQQFSHNEAELANQRALENYWATQSPESRVQQYKDAGLSVGLMYGGANSGGGIGVTSQANTPSANLPVMQSPMANGLNDLFENIKKMQETANIGEDTEKKKQEIENLKSEIEVNNETITKIATENNLTEVLTANAKLDGSLKEIELEVSEGTKENRIQIVAEQLNNMKLEGEKMLKEIEGLQIDNENKQRMYDATLKKMIAETTLVWKQVIKTEQETLLVKAQTALTSEQTNMTFAERQNAYQEFKNLKSLNAKIDAEIKLIEQQTGKVKLEKVTEIIGWIESAAKTSDKIAGTVLKATFMPK